MPASTSSNVCTIFRHWCPRQMNDIQPFRSFVSFQVKWHSIELFRLIKTFARTANGTGVVGTDNENAFTSSSSYFCVRRAHTMWCLSCDLRKEFQSQRRARIIIIIERQRREHESKWEFRRVSTAFNWNTTTFFNVYGVCSPSLSLARVSRWQTLSDSDNRIEYILLFWRRQ